MRANILIVFFQIVIRVNVKNVLIGCGDCRVDGAHWTAISSHPKIRLIRRCFCFYDLIYYCNPSITYVNI